MGDQIQTGPESVKEPLKAGQVEIAKAKETPKAPSPERKRSRNLSEDKRFKLFSGTANRELARKIARAHRGQGRRNQDQRFADGEVYFQLLENVRGVDVRGAAHLLPGGSAPARAVGHDGCAQARLGGRITVVMPYYGYARQDRKDRPRVAISAKLVADLITTGAPIAPFVDLHAAQIQGFFNIPVDHLYASPVLVSYFREMEPGQSDGGFARCGRRGAGALFRAEDGRSAGHVDKRRTDLNGPKS